MGIIGRIESFLRPPVPWLELVVVTRGCDWWIYIGFSEIFVVALFPELGGYKDAFAFFFLILGTTF